MERAKQNWQRVPKSVRKPLVFIVGVAVVATGLLGLLLPVLPGWALIFVGFAILATEFAVAERVRDWMIAQIKGLVARCQRWWRKLRRRS